MPGPSPWNAERITLMKQIYRNGSFKWLALELNRLTGAEFTRGAISGKLMRLGLISQAKPNPNKITMKRATKRLPEAEDETDEFLGVDLIDLAFDQCHYPHGEKSPFSFCGQPTVDGQPYCAKHHRLCHTASPPMRRLNW